MSKILTLGIDPSLLATGVALLEVSSEGSRLLCATTNTRATATGVSISWLAISVIQSIRNMLLGQPTPDIWAIELPVLVRGTGVVVRQGILIGAICAHIEHEWGKECSQIHPSQTKAALGLPARTKKKEVVERVRQTIQGYTEQYTHLDRKVVLEAVADACGVAKAGFILH